MADLPDQTERSAPHPERPSIWRSKLLLLAALLTLLGAGLWIRDALAPAPPPATPLAAGSLTDTGAGAPEQAPAADAPLPFRIGAGFMGGFFIAWAARKTIRITLLVGGAIVATIAVLKGTGVIDLDWAGVERTVQEGMTQAQAQAGAAKDFALRHLPGGFASATGMFVGWRRG